MDDKYADVKEEYGLARERFLLGVLSDEDYDKARDKYTAAMDEFDRERHPQEGE